MALPVAARKSEDALLNERLEQEPTRVRRRKCRGIHHRAATRPREVELLPSERFERATTRLCVFKEAKMATGTVKFFNVQKGFGFIVQDGGGPDVFVHISAVEHAGMSNLVEGQKLRYDIQADPRKGKSAAANLQAA
jgi:cold shock protein